MGMHASSWLNIVRGALPSKETLILAPSHPSCCNQICTFDAATHLMPLLGFLSQQIQGLEFGLVHHQKSGITPCVSV